MAINRPLIKSEELRNHFFECIESQAGFPSQEESEVCYEILIEALREDANRSATNLQQYLNRAPPTVRGAAMVMLYRTFEQLCVELLHLARRETLEIRA